MSTHPIFTGTYSTLTYLALPFVLGRMAVKGFKAPEYRKRWGERLGRPGFAPLDRSVWIHAVSVGEAQAAMPLIHALVTDYPHLKTVVTTTTPTGSALVKRQLGEQILHSYLPYDMPGFVTRFIEHINPALTVVMETEIWPTLFVQLARREIPLILANGRLSANSAKGYSKIRPLMSTVLNSCSKILAQSQADAQRFINLGTASDKVTVSGNLKFDIRLPTAQISAGRHLHKDLGPDRPVWIAASTHAGEDEIMLQAHAALRQTCPDALLILVPRHPERFNSVYEQSVRYGFQTVRHSLKASGWPFSVQPDVYVGDTMGELMMFFAAADIAVVGGSFVPTGGHNVLEPASLGLPVITGDHHHNFQSIVDLLLQSNGLKVVSDHQSLAACLKSLFDSPTQRQGMGDQAQATVQAHTGATRFTLQELATFLEQEPLQHNDVPISFF